MIANNTEQAEYLAMLATQIRRNRATITRRRTSLRTALEHQKRFLREALDEGMPPKKVARISGLTEARISQIRNEGGPPGQRVRPHRGITPAHYGDKPRSNCSPLGPNTLKHLIGNSQIHH